MRYSFLPLRTADTGQDAGNTVSGPDKVTDPTKPKADAALDGEKKFSQAEFDTKLDAALKERETRIKRQFERQQQEAQQQMEAQQLEAQAEWQKLANRRADEIKDLKPRATLAETYERSVKALLTELTQDLPIGIQALLEKLSLPDQVDWLAQNAQSIKPPPAASGATDINAWSRSSAPASGLTDEEYRKKKRRESSSYM